MNRRIVQFFCLLGLFGGSSRDCVAIERDYRSPDFGVSIPGIGELEDRGSNQIQYLGNALCQYAILMDRGSDEQVKALVLAWKCSRPEDQSRVMEVDFYLRLGKFPKEFLEDSNMRLEGELAELSAQIFRLVEGLKRNPGETEKAIVAHALDLLQSKRVPFDIRSKAATELSSMGKPSWDGVIEAIAIASSKRFNDKKALVPASLEDGKFKRNESSINGGFLARSSGYKFIGKISKLKAVLGEASSLEEPTDILFNQRLEDSMLSALSEVHKFLSVRHKGFPTGKKVEIIFKEQFVSKDGPSAAVPFALLLESLITGDEFDPKFAVTGDMNADGTVHELGGIEEKIRGAVKAKCTHIGIPRGNESLLSDMVALGNAKLLVETQVFSIGKFEKALALAKMPDSRDPKIQEAIATFTQVQTVLLKPGGLGLLTNSHVKERLRKVLSSAPNHESARWLLLIGEGRIPKQLSLRGSFYQIDQVTGPIMSILRTGALPSSAEGLKDSMFALRKIRSRLDNRARATADSLEELSRILETLTKSTLDNRDEGFQVLLGKYRTALNRVQTEYNKLASNPDVQEELIK